MTETSASTPEGVLAGRRIVVTGAATGIGAGTVRALELTGAAVAATYHHVAPPDDLTATWLPCDVTDGASVDEMMRDANAALGGLDVVIHAAGLWQPDTPGTIDDAHVANLVSINLLGTIHVNQAAFAVMKETGGRIVNFGSSEAVMGSPISAVYAATKGAVHAWTRSVARAWGRYGITVNTVAPAMETPGANRLREYLGPDAAKHMDERMKTMIPIKGALGDPAHDLGPLLAFLAGPGSGYITGQLISVDGGLMMLGA